MMVQALASSVVGFVVLEVAAALRGGMVGGWGVVWGI